MLSRFSSLLIYVAAGLVISAAATPMAPPQPYDDGSKAPSYPASSYSSPSPPKYPSDKSYAMPYADKKPCPKEKKYDDKKYDDKKHPQEKKYDDKKYPQEKKYDDKKYDDKKYPEEKRPEKEYPEEKRPEKKYPEEKRPEKEYPEEKRPEKKYPEEKRPQEKSYAKRGGRPQMGKGNSYGDRPKNNNQCNVGKQQCCNPVNKSDNDDSQFAGILSILAITGAKDIKERIKSSDKLVGVDCSQEFSGKQCKAQPMCCEDNYFGGFLGVGCTNFEFL